MRTLPTAAAPSAQPAPIAPALRKTIILAKIDKLQAQEPPTLKSWGYQQMKDFGADVAQLKSLARGPLSHILRISSRIARAYGVDMAQIDPCHGDGA